ncbi:MAG: NAD(+) synthase [Erysipelotrichaceae bacterium]|nr:NAD(+) synthase [Erysipelotrichaceae bacterium]
MKNQMIYAAAAVPSMRVADVKYNTEQIKQILHACSDCGIVVFPELCVTGYTCADLFGSDLLLEQAEKAMFEIARETEQIEGLTAVIGVPIRFENNLYNCAAMLSHGEVCALVPKEFIPNDSEFYEERWFASGKQLIGRTIVLQGQEIPIGIDIIGEDPSSNAVIGVEICEDLWVPDKPSTHLALAGANIIVNPSASDELIGKQEYRTNLVVQQSGACYCAYVYASSGMDESSTDLVFSGHTMIAVNGSLLKQNVFPERPYIEKAVIDLSRILHDRRHQNTFDNNDDSWFRRVELDVKPLEGQAEPSTREMALLLKRADYPVARNPFVPADDAERGQRCRKILRIQANGLATRVRATHINNLVIGISGGLDSTLALLVCHEAKKLVPQIRILAYTMPNEGNTSGQTYNNANELMRLLADEIYEVPIAKGVKSHLEDIGHSLEYQGEGDTAYENAQARMRTYILMDAANMKNGLVVGTGDLSELALGWCTYNGDHMSMYAVNASVPKTLVQYICRSYADTCGNDELKQVLHAICDTPITPELTPSMDGQIAQKTEEKIGKYDLNDFFLFYTLRYGYEPSRSMALALRAYPELSYEDVKQAAQRFFKRFFTQQFKRSCLPDGPKVGSVTLSPRGDWRMPSDASVNLWLSDIEE